MTLYRLIVFLAIAGCFTIVGCSRQEEKRGDVFATPMTNYSVTEFATFQSFRAKMADKHVGSYRDIHSGKTNYFFTVFLEITNGKPFAVSGNPASQDMIQVVNLLEKGRDYTFPNAFTRIPQDF
jgi:hypothetical protein